MNPDKQKPAEPETESTDAGQSRRAAEASSRRAAKQGDARRDPGQLKKNQERLGVGSDHKTSEMKKGRRGTFP